MAFKKLTLARGLRLVSFYGLAVAALASLGAVVSGIALTKGDMWGRGDFGWHHRFVWPAFSLPVTLAVWRRSKLKTTVPLPSRMFRFVRTADEILDKSVG